MSYHKPQKDMRELLMQTANLKKYLKRLQTYDSNYVAFWKRQH